MKLQFYLYMRNYYQQKNTASEARHSCLTESQKNHAFVIKKFFDLGKQLRERGAMTEEDYAQYCGAQFGDLNLIRRPNRVIATLLFYF